MALCGFPTPRLSSSDPDFAYSQEIRVQFADQLKCLETRTESHSSLLFELQEYCRRRSEIESDYSKSLDKLHRQIAAKHKAEKQKRETWGTFAAYGMWKMLVEDAKVESRNRSVLADLLANHVAVKVASLADQIQRVSKRCREIGALCQGEIVRVLGELHTAFKTYQLCYAACRGAQIKVKLAESQKSRYEASCPKKVGCRKHRLLEKAYDRKYAKYSDYHLKAEKARNEYLLCIESANAALHKYFAEDLSDIVDCMDIGMASLLSHLVSITVDAKQSLAASEMRSVNAFREWCLNLDPRADKQRFLESHHDLFILPRRFEFRAHDGDDVKQISASKALSDELSQRYWQLHQRLVHLKTEIEEVWKTLETTEMSIVDAQQQPRLNVVECFALPDGHGPRQGVVSCREPDVCQQKRRSDVCEFEDFYLNKFQQFLMTGNLAVRLEARFTAVKSALGLAVTSDGSVSSSGCPAANSPSSNSGGCPAIMDAAAMQSDASGPSAVQCSRPRRRRIGAVAGNPDQRNKLFGGSLEEYVEATGQEIPLIIRSCIRMLSMFGLHHQGVFRVSGSQIEINAFKEAFERNQDPLAGVTDASDVNSVAGVLKLYFRELREPLFPFYMFDQFVECACLESKAEFVAKVGELVTKLSRPTFVVMRYLFSFLNHLSEFSDENMMDPYNLAICFGPTLLPIPESKDQVFYHNHVNELMRSLILYHDEIFPNDGGLVYDKYRFAGQYDVGDEDEEMAIGDEEDVVQRVDSSAYITTDEQETKVACNGDADYTTYMNEDLSEGDLVVTSSGSASPGQNRKARLQMLDEDVMNESGHETPIVLNGLLVNELTGYSPTVVSRRSRLLHRGSNQMRLPVPPDSGSAIYSQPFKVSSPTMEESPSPGDQSLAFNWDVSAEEVESTSHNPYACLSKTKCQKNGFKRLSLCAYAQPSLPAARDVCKLSMAVAPLQCTDGSAADGVDPLSPQSLREIQCELKAVLTSLETFTMHQQQSRSGDPMSSPCPASGEKTQTLTPDLVKNLPEKMDQENKVPVDSCRRSQELCGGDESFISSVTVESTTFAERFAQSRESTMRKLSTSPCGQPCPPRSATEATSFPYIDQPSSECLCDYACTAQPSPKSRTVTNKPPVPKKPSNCTLGSS